MTLTEPAVRARRRSGGRGIHPSSPCGANAVGHKTNPINRRTGMGEGHRARAGPRGFEGAVGRGRHSGRRIQVIT
ncbi:hypothetical protein A11S_1767 [Micavibrio aeruginosavorus EPB]|uniref:Uncharacterized protein n=1 Tax=Micavibrio aeruginosavorus EPB TaxID=349215 RepID=M4VZG7_9BACT|nr:hypothetical protein A11S_1767 [Micavibrio aeruginosavorus EPB]